MVILTQSSSFLRCGPERESARAGGCGEPRLFTHSASGVAMATLHGPPTCSLPPPNRKPSVAKGSAWGLPGRQQVPRGQVSDLHIGPISKKFFTVGHSMAAGYRHADGLLQPRGRPRLPSGPSPPRQLPGARSGESAEHHLGQDGQVPTHRRGVWLPLRDPLLTVDYRC